MMANGEVFVVFLCNLAAKSVKLSLPDGCRSRLMLFKRSNEVHPWGDATDIHEDM